MAGAAPGAKLRKELGLFDVYAICTGAMFSSGFFLLPGLAAAKTGPSVMLAYLFAGVLILPAMFSQAELSTALPRAGGAYYFLDRALGPMIGTIGGLGTFFALTLKTAFALVGIGAYASLYVEVPVKTVAIVLTAVFVGINVVGAKESSGLQRVLVVILMGVLAFFIVQGLLEVFVDQSPERTREQLTPFMPFGVAGLLSTIGFVFVSYAGLTKVASVAEEIKNPDRNIPLGMILALASTSFVYVAGVFILVEVLDPNELRSDLTPVATAAAAFFDWLPSGAGVVLIVIAALAAFASTGNAGVLAASRYPLAMARDRLVPTSLANLGRFQTPTRAILLTGAVMVAFILAFDEEGIAKLASAFQLAIFALINLAVIVMRESRIRSYDPGYRSPLYPWMQLAGIVISFVLIAYMGWMAVLFTIGIIAFCIGWYVWYARDHVVRDGAIYHWFARLGERRYEGLDREFRGILKEKGLRDEDPFDEVVMRARVLDVSPAASYEDVLRDGARLLAERVPVPLATLEQGFLDGTRVGATPTIRGAALPHLRLLEVSEPELVLARSRQGLELEVTDSLGTAHAALPADEDDPLVHAVFLLISPEDDPGQHLRMLAQIASRLDDPGFMDAWQAAPDAQALTDLLLRDARFLTLRLRDDDATESLIDRKLMEVQWPPDCLVAMIRRGETMVVPQGRTVLQEGDRVTLLGEPAAIRALRTTYLDDA
ncbi:MAG: amino acid permease [Bacteroidota bacterium]